MFKIFFTQISRIIAHIDNKFESGIDFAESVYNNNNIRFRRDWLGSVVARGQPSDYRVCGGRNEMKDRRRSVAHARLRNQRTYPFADFTVPFAFFPHVLRTKSFPGVFSEFFFLLLNAIGHYSGTLRNYRTKGKCYSLHGNRFCTQYIRI